MNITTEYLSAPFAVAATKSPQDQRLLNACQRIWGQQGGEVDLDYVRVLQRIPVSGLGEFVCVVGDRDNGWYDWVIETRKTVECSHAQYGESSVALRDGLIAYHDLPEAHEPIRKFAKTVAL